MITIMYSVKQKTCTQVGLKMNHRFAVIIEVKVVGSTNTHIFDDWFNSLALPFF